MRAITYRSHSIYWFIVCLTFGPEGSKGDYSVIDDMGNLVMVTEDFGCENLLEDYFTE